MTISPPSTSSCMSCFLQVVNEPWSTPLAASSGEVQAKQTASTTNVCSSIEHCTSDRPPCSTRRARRSKQRPMTWRWARPTSAWGHRATSGPLGGRGRPKRYEAELRAVHHGVWRSREGAQRFGYHNGSPEDGQRQRKARHRHDRFELDRRHLAGQEEGREGPEARRHGGPAEDRARKKFAEEFDESAGGIMNSGRPEQHVAPPPHPDAMPRFDESAEIISEEAMRCYRNNCRPHAGAVGLPRETHRRRPESRGGIVSGAGATTQELGGQFDQTG